MSTGPWRSSRRPRASTERRRSPASLPAARGGRCGPRDRAAPACRWCSWRWLLQAVALQAAVEGAAAEAERIGGMAHIAAETRQRFFDEQRLDIFEAHLFEARRPFASGAQAEVGGADLISLRHEDGALHSVIQFADVAGPCVRQQRFDGGFLKASDGL